ncbi:diguanylate phosphodiesterase [Klebsiella oxytoca]|uniref:diguanylate phosphodiesterase n=1 Tax=Klebsiella oxytoca TaxID=571 RepID=UPI001CCB95AA|nr:diguanylate phosphodiesterase [Klebsiella oxytoca]MBZ7309075.1 diguanylate phosphodiesterase [Klebsiella oxytoca]
MLTTLIYRSHVRSGTSYHSIIEMVKSANERNIQIGVTGILLFNGIHFFQLLEGQEESVKKIFSSIICDGRHFNVVKLLYDFSPSRRFGNAGMELIDIRCHSKEKSLTTVLERGTTQHKLLYNDRALRFFRTFIESTEKDNYYELPDKSEWCFSPETLDFSSLTELNIIDIKPVVDPFAKEVHSFELIPNAQKKISENIHLDDITSKRDALSFAGKFILAHQRVSVSLLPMTLVKVPRSVETLLDYIQSSNLHPEQLIVQFSESAIINDIDEFTQSVRKLKSAGISIAISDFGAGHAGLRLLANFQPEKVKIHHDLTRNINQDGSRQAIVQSIINCCEKLEIRVCATGIEQPEEWMWLESAGIFCFQGNLFSGYNKINQLIVSWPNLIRDTNDNCI